MKATIYKGIKQIQLEEIQDPVPGEKDVVVKIVRAGICGTDVHAYLHGGEPVGILLGNQFGHEMVGFVYTVGSKVEGIEKGLRVFVDPNNRKPCGQGLNPTQIADMAGAFSEYVLVEEAKIDYNIFILPDELSFDKAVLIEPLSVATHAVSRSNLVGGEVALIYGSGTIGLCVLVALKNSGVKKVIVLDINQTRLDIAEKLGAISYNSGNGDSMKYVKKQFGTRTGNADEETTNVDIVFDAAGAPFIIPEYLYNAKVLSKLIIIAVHGKEVNFSPYQMLSSELNIMGSRGYIAKDIIRSIAILSDANSVITPIITHQFCHKDIVEAFAIAADADKAIKVVIDYN